MMPALLTARKSPDDYHIQTYPTPVRGPTMSLRPRNFLLLSTLVSVGCKPSVSVSSPTPDAATSYVVRLGTDTVAVEQFRRTGNHIESEIIQRAPLTYIGRSVIELGPNGLATSWTYDPRLVSGARRPGVPTQMLTLGPDSVTIVSDTGAQYRRRVAGSAAVPNLGNSMLTYDLAIAYARTSGRDSVTVPTVNASGGRGAIQIRFITRDSVRSWYGPDPIYMKLDAQGHIVWFNANATTNKIMGMRVPGADVRALASAFTARDQTGGAMGTASPRDTARVQISGSPIWIDYGRPSLRGRDVWADPILGDKLWRTGANAATQIQTPVDLIIAGQTIPAGKYTLWTRVLPGNSGYELIFNKQVGQWGTVYDAKQDLVRVPLAVKRIATSAERFTMMIEPSGDGGVLAMQWGTTRLETPFIIKR